MNLQTFILLASIALLQIIETVAFASTVNMSERQKKRARTESGTKPAEGEDGLSYVEFYSGIGGWTMAFEQALGELQSKEKPPRKPKRLAVLDHSDLCMRVFEHNFGKDRTRSLQIQIERLTKEQVETWKAKFWFMSPPCRKFACI